MKGFTGRTGGHWAAGKGKEHKMGAYNNSLVIITSE